MSLEAQELPASVDFQARKITPLITGMWVVTPAMEGLGRKSLAIVSLDCIARAAHLLPVYGSALLPEDFHFSYSLDVFRAFFVNRYTDHHTFEFLQ
ncbi:hypothetical protein B0H11DRAFT_1862373 [Mycena galericulata]|nr:hypothetical protein B0H11DRAFT_1862373 [Mycena galericulata]